MALVRSISVSGAGPVVLKPGRTTMTGRFQKVMRMEELPKDTTRFRLNAAHDDKDATFKPAPGGNYLGVTPHRYK